MILMELPQLDERRCTACGDCVVVCPAHCLEMMPFLPALARPLDCVSCSLCVLICPEEALTMRESGPRSSERQT